MYGKDFVSAAIGLQSDSGVSRLLVDKLSVKALDGPTKNKILKEIATEHNVTWEPESLVEPDPKETVLMSGASSSQSNLYETGGISSSRTASTDHYRQDPRPSEWWQRTQTLIQVMWIHLHTKQIADATTAAHAAAESAERVSFAARAAAELSSKKKDEDDDT
ncbi:hypothetical protein F2Q69_00055659 [Brassica cretica]|uniref:Uncharacterized protein n=1 Tax=Brassica cretica TaxID=69181 RepID=A0A8S9N2V4_BRACR|nr:hypothetical protein F2Q69_00055659 [Brassica cretica]